MKTLARVWLTLILLILTGLSTVSFAEDDVGFDAIVEDLQSSTRLGSLDSADPFDSVMIHASVGLVGAYNQIRIPNEATSSGWLNGVEARFGIDLFSPYWQAQGAIRSFDQTRISSELSASLKEFDLSILHSGTVNRRLAWHIGAGVAARYLRVIQKQSGETNFTTPSSIVATGLTVNFTEKVGLTTDLSWRRAFIDETADRMGYQASLSLDAQF